MSCDSSCSGKNLADMCPSRMNDARAFTDYRFRCDKNAELMSQVAASKLPASSYDSRMFLQRNAEKFTLPPGRSVPVAIKALMRTPNVRYAEPDYVLTKAATSNDPYYTGGNLWGMYGDATSPANQFGSQAGEAWAAGYTGSRSVYIGVIDEGIQVTHPDLQANIWVNPHEIPGDGIDNDGNGRIDDIHGWDFFNNNNSVYDAGEDAHGTHVAGTIGGVGGDGLGVVGVNWQVTMISGKFLGAGGGSTSGAIAAVDYFNDLKTRHGLNIVATSNSWGGGGFSQALLDAQARAVAVAYDDGQLEPTGRGVLSERLRDTGIDAQGCPADPDPAGRPVTLSSQVGAGSG